MPPGYHVETHARPWLTVTGGFLFGVFYAGALAMGTSGQCPYNRWALVPVVGPFIASDNYGHSHPVGPCEDSDRVGEATMSLDGTGQLLGTAFLLTAVFYPERELVPDRRAGSPRPASLWNWHVVPAVGTSGVGVSVLIRHE